MTIRNAINSATDWQWECLQMTANGATITDFSGNSQGSATSGYGYVLEVNEEIDWTSIMVYVQTAETTGTKTLSIGFGVSSESGYSSSSNQLLYGVSTANTGYVRPSWTLSSISSVGYYISASTLGTAFQVGNAGTSALNAVPIFQNYMGNGTLKTLTYLGQSTNATFVAWFMFRRRKNPDLSKFLLDTF